MPSTALSLTAFLGIMSSFQGIVALPASSASSSSPESTTILGSPLSFGPESTTTLGEPVQATPTATVPSAATLNSTSSAGSDSDNSVTQIYSRTTKEAWVEFHGDDKCESKVIGKHINLGNQKCHKTVVDPAAKFMGVSWGDAFTPLDNFWAWNSTDCTGEHFKVWRNRPDIEPGSCVPNYPGMQSIRWTEKDNTIVS